jgi:hypothetical protein
MKVDWRVELLELSLENEMVVQSVGEMVAQMGLWLDE